MSGAQAIALVAIGDELLDGRYPEGHTVRLARALRERGRRLGEVRIVRDRVDAIVDALDALAPRASAIVVTGGLGVTDDDLTRDAIAQWLGVELEEPLDELTRVREWLVRRGKPDALDKDDALRRHAQVPAGAEVLGNPVGLAAAFVVLRGTLPVVVLPGVPSELEALLPVAIDRLCLDDAPGAAWRQRRVLVYGLPEREVERALESLPVPDGFSHGVVPLGGLVELSISGQGDPEALESHTSAVVERLGDAVVSADGSSLAERVGQALSVSAQTVSTAESCTGGLVASLITDVAGSSAWFHEGAVTYTNEAKTARLGVRPETLATHGAVSRATVEEMATGMRERAGTDWAIAISGIAGPGGGSAAKPVGTVHTAIAGPDGALHDELLQLPGLSRVAVKQRTALAVLAHLLRRVG